MITIIKRGTKQTKECKECGCLFSFDEDDIELQEDWNQTYKKLIRCPQCENVIILEATR